MIPRAGNRTGHVSAGRSRAVLRTIPGALGELEYQVKGRETTVFHPGGEIRILLHISYGNAGAACHLSPIRLDQTRHHFHQGRLARPIAPHKCDPVPRLNDQPKRIKNWVATKGERDVIELKQGDSGHMRQLCRLAICVNIYVAVFGAGTSNWATARKVLWRRSGIRAISTLVNT